MFSSLKLSIRHLWQSRLYAVLNIIGLATGITCMLLATLYWRDERDFDTFHDNNPNLYRITTTVNDKDGRTSVLGLTGQVHIPAFTRTVPEIKSATRVRGGDIFNDMIAGDKSFHLRPLYVDPTFFDVFSFSLLKGNPKTALAKVDNVVLTESAARRFFNSTDVIGKLVEINSDPSYEKLGKPLIVSAVVTDPPVNSSLQFDVLLSFEFTQLAFAETSWAGTYIGSFVVLYPDADINKVLSKFNQVAAEQSKEQLAETLKMLGYEMKYSYGLQLFTDIHLNPLGSGGRQSGILNVSSPIYSYFFMGVAGLILLMATINFVNISIANSLKRAKEVGIRKISGGKRIQIVMQFFQESSVLCLISFLLSIILMKLSLPLFNELAAKQIQFWEAIQPETIIYFVILFIAIIFFSASYPAFVLSRFKPTEVLYNRQRLSGKNILGRALVVLQFSLAIFLLVATIIYYQQMNYIRTKDLGYEPSYVIHTSLKAQGKPPTIFSELKNDLAAEPSILSFSLGDDGQPREIEAGQHKLKVTYKTIDESFLSTLNISLLAGRNLSEKFATDMKESVLVNEAFVKAAGLTEPIGSPVKIIDKYATANNQFQTSEKTKIIRGVVKDFHFGSLRQAIEPLVLYTSEFPSVDIWIKIDRTKQQQAMAAVEKIYKKILPGAIYQYSFLDELNAREYQKEKRWQKLITVGSTLALIICCLGLFGLAHLSTVRRVKEIGIRKVLGATVTQISVLLSVNFLKLVLIAFVLSAPIAWWVMNSWLQEFAYRIEPGPGIFIGAALFALVIAAATVSLHAIRSAWANPVKTLRNE